MKTKYNGNIEKEDILSYYDRLIGKVFKLLPIREYSEKDFKYQYDSLMNELVCGERLLLNGGFYIELLNKLEGLSDLPHKSFTKSPFNKRIVECIDVIKLLRKQLEDRLEED